MRITSFILVSFICYTCSSQSNKQFIDSIGSVIKSNGYNFRNIEKKKQGYWIYLNSYPRLERNIEIRTYSGFYKSGKKIGVWDEKKYGLWLRKREIYIDSMEMEKIVINFEENGKLSDEGVWIYDSVHPDILQKYNEKTERLDTSYVKGKYLKNGIFKNYWENGTMKSYGKMERDNEKGIWKYYNEKGELVETKTF